MTSEIKTGVMDAYRDLVALAGSGRSYQGDEVYWDHDPKYTTEVVGRGLDFTQPVNVPVSGDDQPDGTTVKGTASLRILLLINGDGPSSLFLRIRLTWPSAQEGSEEEHQSFASYDITEQAAARLAATDPAVSEAKGEALAAELQTVVDRHDAGELTDDEGRGEVAEILALDAFDALEAAQPYNADWIQTYPDLLEAESEEAMAAICHRHEAGVLGAKEAEPQLLCMLSIYDAGAVEPGELADLLAWVQAHPECAVA